MPKRRLVGTVTKANQFETATVTIAKTRRHARYLKRYRADQRYAAHNPRNTYQVGDVVEVEEHRPISKTKHWLIRRRASDSPSKAA